MHVGIAVIGLMRVLRRVVRVHVIWHRASIDQEIGRVVWLRRDIETATGAARSSGGASRSSRLDLRFCLRVNSRIHLRELEQVLPVVATIGMVVCRANPATCVWQSVVTFTPVRFSREIASMDSRSAGGRNGGGKHYNRAIQAHLDLQIALRAAVIRASSGS